LVAAVIGYLSGQGGRKAQETYWLARASGPNTIETATSFIDPLLSYWLARAKPENASPEAVIGYFTEAHEAEPMNWETDYILGEYLWLLSQQLGPDYLQRASQALNWYAKSIPLNPFDAYAPMACGRCLDRLGKTDEATPYFRQAIQKDPHNCYIAQEVARHCIALGEYAAARRWLRDGAERSDATDVAIVETDHLEELLADPLYLATAGLQHTNQAPPRKQEMADPLLEGPK
jgi:tetratricopeptide (TPR) repeat protein